jgi:hypothetical protein
MWSRSTGVLNRCFRALGLAGPGSAWMSGSSSGLQLQAVDQAGQPVGDCRLRPGRPGRARSRRCSGLLPFRQTQKCQALFASAADGFRSQRPKPAVTRGQASAVAQGVRGRQPSGRRRLPCFGAPLNGRIEQKCLSNVANIPIIAQGCTSLNGQKKPIRLKHVAWSRHRIPLSCL